MRSNRVAMRGQPPVIWNRAEGFQVSDAWGNTWIDWSSGVLIANAGHGRPEIADAIAQQAHAHLLTSFNFANEPRARLVERLVEILPEPLKKVFLYSIGSEAVECALKMCRTYGVKSRRTLEARDRVVPERVSRTDARRAAGGRHPGAEAVDRESGPGLRAGPVSRRLPHAGHLVRQLRALPAGAGHRAAERRRA